MLELLQSGGKAIHASMLSTLTLQKFVQSINNSLACTVSYLVA
jgi:hypothetical protein